MSRIYKTGAMITPTVDTDRDLFGATGFKASYVNNTTAVATSIAAAFSEVVLPTDGNTSDTSAEVLVGATIIPVADGTQFAKGNVVDDGAGNLHYILSVSGNDLETKRPIEATIATATTITQAGNTGLYNVSFAIHTEGDYKIIISNPSLNMQNVVLPVMVRDEILSDAHTKLDGIISQLGASKAKVSFSTYV